MIEKFAVKAKKEFVKDGENKSIWLGVGTVIKFDNGSMILELNMFPGKQFGIFPIDKNRESHDENV